MSPRVDRRGGRKARDDTWCSSWWRNRRRHIWEVESPSAKVAEPNEFRCSGIPFRQGTSLRLEPHFKFIIGAESSEDLRLRLGFCIAKRQGSIRSIHSLR